MKRFFVALLLAVSLATPLPSALAQRKAKVAAGTPTQLATQRGVDQITAAQMRAFLTFIASDEMEGRDTPSRGLDTTAKFIAMNLTRWGFKPAGDDGSYFQHIALHRDRVDASQTTAALNAQSLTLGDDYIPIANGGAASGQLVFVGNGWFIKAKNMDAYGDVDAKGKIAVIFGSPNVPPRGVRRGDLSGKQGEDWMNPFDNARKHGVVGLVFVPGFQLLANWDATRKQVMDGGRAQLVNPQATAPVPAIIAAPKLANALFLGESRGATTLFEDASHEGSPVPSPFALSAAKTLTMNVALKSDGAGTQNVVAVWEGSDPVLKNEYVAVGAHYDHIGVAGTGSGQCPAVNGDNICNGADDDGSGTTAVLAMAEALSHASQRPKRSVLFVWHCGEEKGLWGSRYFTDHPTVPLDHVVTQLNIDMIGRSKKEGDTNPRNATLTGPNEIYVIGHTMMSSELAELSEAVNKSFLNVGYDYRYDDPKDPNRFFYRSDHFNYARKGIPIIFFFDGVHEDYHQPGDSPDKIDFQKMEKVTRTIYMTLWDLGNRATRPKVDKPLPAQLAGQ